MGRLQPADQRGALRRAPRRASSTTSRTRAVRPGPVRRRRSDLSPALGACYTETAWASIFARTCSSGRRATELAAFAPNFTIIDAPSFKADPERDGTRTETAILVHLRAQEIIIVGTEYAGEIKKGAFGIMNFRLPDEGVLPMHSSVNVGEDGDAAIFFGLSGTGKTTLSADPERTLIGDDEHGWSDGGVFNFEGGCYAKTIRLSPIYEPDIFATTRRFGTILENVVIDPATRELDLDSEQLTENTRGAFPLHFISNADATGHRRAPAQRRVPDRRRVRRAAADRKLTREQAMYHFISGYTAKLAGTEVGVKEPTATFSTCFGAPFMPRHPGVYAQMLGERLERHDVPGVAGEHRLDRWPVRRRRADEHHPHAADGPRGARRRARRRRDARGSDLRRRRCRCTCPDVPDEVLWPRDTWADPDAYDAQARKLATMFLENFARFADGVGEAVRAAGPVEVHEAHGDIAVSAPGEG